MGIFMADSRKAEFSFLLREAGFSKSEFAEVFGLSSSTVSRWGESPPKWALVYLRSVVEQKRWLRRYGGQRILGRS